MSTRKSANRANTDSPVSTGSGDSTSTRSTTRLSLQTAAAATTTGCGNNEQDINAATTTITTNIATVNEPTTTVQETKRSRRTNVRTPTTPTSTSSSCSNSKKKSDEADETSSIPGTDVEDDKSVKSLTEEIIKNEDEKKTECLTESPVRAARKRKVFDKTAIVTRKSAAMDLANANAKRVLRCDRRNSTGKLEGIDNNEVKKRQVKKFLSSTPEPTPTTTNTLKRKRINSVRPEEEIKRAEKMIKIENMEPVDEVQTKEDEATTKDSESIEMVGIKQEINDDAADVVALTTATIPKQLEDDEQMSADYNIKNEVDHVDEDKIESKSCSDGGDMTGSQKEQIENKIDGDQKSIESKSEGSAEISTSLTGNDKIDSAKNGSKDDVAVAPPPEKPRRGRPPKKLLNPTAVATATAATSPAKKVGKKSNASANKESAKKTKFSKRISAQELRSAEVTADTTTEDEIVSLNSTEDISDKNVNTTQEEEKVLPPSSSLEKPLTVDTVSSSIITTVSEKESPSTSSDKNSGKAASLSPELVSEEISVISVKQFYKKPEFLENNLGIEKDPKLGEIVQEVEKTKEEEEEEKESSSGTEIVADENTSETTAVTTSIENAAPIENSPNCSGDSLKEEERLVFDMSTEDEASCSTNKLGNDDGSEATTATEVVLEGSNAMPPSEVSKETDQENEPIEEKDSIDNGNGDGNEEELIKSNSAAAAETLHTLQSTCDNNSRNTAVEDIVEDVGGNGENESDIETKDRIECNKNSLEECIQEEKNCNEQKLNEKTDASSTEEEREEKNKDMNEIDIKELTDVNSEELLGEAEESNMDSESLHEDGDKTEDVKVKEQEDIVMDEDESKENKENVSITTDMKDTTAAAAAATFQSIVNSPKMIETQEEEIVINKRDKKLLETPETLKQKENHLKHLGLLTHKAAVEAKIEKQRRRKLLQNNILGNGSGGNSSNSSSNKRSHNNINDNTSGSDSSTSDNGGRSNGTPTTATTPAGNSNKDSQEYTGTLKTVIKLNRQASNGSANSNSENKRNKAVTNNSSSSGSSSSSNNSNTNGGRQSLKITFQKGRGRGGNTSDKDQNNSANSGDDTYYTIQNETEGPQQQETSSHGRKSYNRYHTTGVCTFYITKCFPL